MNDFAEYQRLTSDTDQYPRETALLCKALGLAGEAGEVANKIKKIYRDNDGNVTPDHVRVLADEMGDVLWYAAQICEELGIGIGWCAANNIAKLADRQERGVLHGDGDER